MFGRIGFRCAFYRQFLAGFEALQVCSIFRVNDQLHRKAFHINQQTLGLAFGAVNPVFELACQRPQVIIVFGEAWSFLLN